MKFASFVIFSAVSVAAATRQLQNAGCAPEGDRSQQCGAENTERPAQCCPGLKCYFNKCVDPNSIATCAPQGDKALECGVNQPNRPDKCCEGLVCDEQKTCSPVGTVPTAEPTVFVPPTPACAGVGERAQDCGATNTDRPQSCCGDLVCGENASVRCQAPTTGGEAAPVVAPTPAAVPVEPTGAPASMTVEPTGVPGTAPPTSEPTMVDVVTDEPTDAADPIPDPTPPSSASKMAAVTAAVAVVVAAPLLL